MQIVTTTGGGGDGTWIKRSYVADRENELIIDLSEQGAR